MSIYHKPFFEPDPESLQHNPWATDPLSGISISETEKTPTSPKILLVDDDPLFCAAVNRKAKKMNLDITICKTLTDIEKLPSNFDFDVAVLDYFFGPELTALQLSALFTHDVPIIVVSNTEGKKLSGDGWPSEVRTFVHKSAGTDAILHEALLAAHWPQLIPSILSGSADGTTSEISKYETPWWLPLVATLAGTIALTVLYLATQGKQKQKFWEWDAAPFESSIQYSQWNLPQKGMKALMNQTQGGVMWIDTGNRHENRRKSQMKRGEL